MRSDAESGEGPKGPLTESLEQLTELLARRVHDTWAQQRVAEGWRYGPTRDGEKKHHPCLVPYEELPEFEKDYDRNTALETLRVIQELGFELRAPQPTGPPPEAVDLEPLKTRLRVGRGWTLPDLLAIWQKRDWEGAGRDPEFHVLMGQRFLTLGEPLMAYDAVAEGLAQQPREPELRRLMALALARSGAARRAQAVLLELHAEGHRNEETLGLLARTHKDLAFQGRTPEEARPHLEAAERLYREAYDLSQGFWSGINAATMALLLGHADAARHLTQRVQAQCLEVLAQPQDDPYWVLATLGEAALLLGEIDASVRWYRQAVEAAPGQYGRFQSTRRNARLILDRTGRDPALVEACFQIPRLVIFHAHEEPHGDCGAAQPSPAEEAALKARIRDLTHSLDCGFGFASPGCLHDLLFLEVLLEQQEEVHIVLPYEQEAFLSDLARGSLPWAERCRQVLARASEVVVASRDRLDPTAASETYTRLYLEGLAQLGAERWGSEVRSLHLAAPSTPVHRPRAHPEAPPMALRAMLFADTVHFSHLSESQIPAYLDHFLGSIAEVLETTSHQPLLKNTWGDALYLVFSGVQEAGGFALELCERIGSRDWTLEGLPESLGLRVALHVGPVWTCPDPVTGHPNCFGSHVSWAARMEPVTPPGLVYVSQAFAALAMAQGVRDFAFDYVGQVPLPKGFGTYPTYHLRRPDRV